MAKKVILTADRTCDLGDELIARYNVAEAMPLHIVLDGKLYDDNVNIFPEQLYERFYADGTLPSTSAISIGEYEDTFRKYTDQGFEVVHISLGSKLSCSHANALLAAKQLDGVYVVDSQSLSSGTGLLVIEAAERIAAGMEAAQVAEEVNALVPHSHASFILDTLKFMAAGGRCSSVVALGANLLQIKPSIEVNNADGGSMVVGKKYRGKYDRCVAEYVTATLQKYDNISTKRIFITHSGIDPQIVELVKRTIAENLKFDEVFETNASCTICSHCGPNCIGVLFMTK